jgi:hypothetical protein
MSAFENPDDSGLRLPAFAIVSAAKIYAEVAQLVEQLIRNQQVTGSNPVFGSIDNQ